MALLIRLSTFFFLAAAANLVACVNATFSFPTFAADARLTYAGTSVYYSKQRDICGVCDGDTSTCQGCDKKPNSPSVFDACGECTSPPGSFSNLTCSSCEQYEGSTGRYNTVHGGGVLDDCGKCKDPTHPSFSHRGIPDFFNGGCIGCDGESNSANELDSCGVCSGLSCSPSDPSKRSWCCDCAGVAFGPNIVDICCDCVSREVHWKALSDGMFGGPPKNHSFAQESWTRGRAKLVQASHLVAYFLDNLTEGTRYRKD